MNLQLKSLLNRAIVDKVLATIGFVFVLAALIVIATTPLATGYELSIYNAYPFYFWLLIIASSACGMGIFIHQAFAAEKSKWWLAGLFLVIFSNSIFLGLPFFRGYAFFPAGDAMTHVGMMKDISVTGHIGEKNFYPVVHLLGVSLRDITGLSYATVTNLLFVFWSMVYLLNIYLLATVLANHRGQALLITAFASPLVFSFSHTLINPSILSLFMVPLLLYFYHRRQKIPSEQVTLTVISLLLVLVITLCHPVTAVFAIALVLALNLSRFLYRKITGRKELTSRGRRAIVGDYIVPLISAITFVVLYLHYPRIREIFTNLRDFLVYGDRTSLYRQQLEALATSGLTTSQTIELFIYRYGAILIYFTIAAIGVGMALRMSLSEKTQLKPMHFNYAVLFIVAVAVSAFSLFGYTGESDPVRISRFFLMVAPIVSGLVVYEFIPRQQPFHLDRLKPGRKALIGVIAILILMASVLSIFNVYGSPWVINQNLQVGQMEITGTEWFSNHQNRDIIVAMRWPTEFERFEDFNFGVESRTFARAKLDPEPIPSHFGYNENSSIAETFDFQDRYLLTCQAARIFPMVIPENIRYKVPQYTEEDFARLSADPAVAKIYATGEFQVWRVYGE